MDPNATYAEYVEAMAAGQYDEAEQAAENLYNWLARGGFKPSFMSRLSDGQALTKARSMMRDAYSASCERGGDQAQSALDGLTQ